MFKSLSKSTIIMFIFDLIILSSVSLYIALDSGFSSAAKISGVIIITLTGLFSLFLKGQYKIREFNITLWNAYRLLEGVIFAQIPALIVLAFMVDKLILLKYVGVNIIAIFVCLYVYRLGFHYYLFNLKKTKRVLIIGANDNAHAVVDVIKNKKALQMEVVGIVKSAEVDKKLSEGLSQALHYELTENDRMTHAYQIKSEEIFAHNGVQIFADGRNIIEIQQQTRPDIIVLAAMSFLTPALDDKVKIYKMSDFYEMATGKFFVHENLMPNFYMEFAQFERSFKGKVYKVCKRIYDIISALIILTVTLPITSYIAIRVWLIDLKSPFFTQTRVGKKGKTFNCYKLRTMYSNDYKPKSGDDVKYAESVQSDDRIIPFCRFVRKARFDEIPQMVNILKGEMSIVGPRAEWTDEAKIFQEQVPFYDARNLVKAGWTGWSHINMNPVFSVDEEKERLSYDLYYIKHRNIFWEIGILVKAVFLAVGGRHK